MHSPRKPQASQSQDRDSLLKRHLLRQEEGTSSMSKKTTSQAKQPSKQVSSQHEPVDAPVPSSPSQKKTKKIAGQAKKAAKGGSIEHKTPVPSSKSSKTAAKAKKAVKSEPRPTRSIKASPGIKKGGVKKPAAKAKTPTKSTPAKSTPAKQVKASKQSESPEAAHQGAEVENGDEYWKVEAFREHTGSGAKLRLLVKWFGYPERDNTWQNAKELREDLKQEYTKLLEAYRTSCGVTEKLN